MFFIEELNLSDYDNIYVVGDIHGMFNHLEKVLKKINFNKEKDLLICTGDLVDRGKESHLAIDYLEKKWFKSVLGNHDIVFIDVEDEYNLHPQYEKETIEIGSDNKLLNKFVNIFSKKLPLIIEVNDGAEKIVITHSGLPIINRYKDFKEILLEEKFFKKSLVNALIWASCSNLIL